MCLLKNARKANPSFQRDQSADRINHTHRQVSRASFPPDSVGVGAEGDGREGEAPRPNPSVGRKPGLSFVSLPFITSCSMRSFSPSCTAQPCQRTITASSNHTRTNPLLAITHHAQSLSTYQRHTCQRIC